MAAQGDDGGGEALLLGDGGELAGGPSDEEAGVAGGIELFERGVDADGLEVEQLHPGQLGHIGVDVARQAEVDDEPLRSLR